MVLMFVSVLNGAEQFAVSIGYQSPSPAYVVINISGLNGKMGIGVIDSKEFTVTEDQKTAIIIELQKLVSNDKKRFGSDIDVGFQIGRQVVMYKDTLGSLENIKIYKRVIELAGVTIPDKYKLP
jgi:hypothetical protein